MKQNLITKINGVDIITVDYQGENLRSRQTYL